LSCFSNLKKVAPKNELTLDITCIDAKLPLYLSSVDFNNRAHLSDEVTAKIKKVVCDNYFNDVVRNKVLKYSKIKDTYINTIRLHEKNQTIFLIIMKNIFGHNIRSKALFYDDVKKTFADKIIDFNINALYDVESNKLKPTDLKLQLKVNSPEIAVVDFKTGGKIWYKFTRLYHNGTANAIETFVINVSQDQIKTLAFKRQFIYQ